MGINVNFQIDLLKALQTVAGNAGLRDNLVKGLLLKAKIMSGDKYNVMVYDLGQRYDSHLKNIHCYAEVEIHNIPYGVWIFESGTFENMGTRGYDHWAFSGDHDFTDGKDSGLVTFRQRR